MSTPPGQRPSPEAPLRIFDMRVEAPSRSAQDLSNLAFFGVSQALICAPSEGARSASEQLEGFERLLGVETARLRAAGLTPYVALGVEGPAIPRRGFREILAALPDLLRRAPVAAVGPLSLGEGSPREQEALRAQMELAASLDLPCLVSLPPRGKLWAIAQGLSVASAAGLKPSRVAFDHADGRAALRARAAGAWACLTVHPDHLRPEAAVKILSQQGPARLLFDSALGTGPGDILALPKVALGLGREGTPPEIIRRAMSENALSFLGLASLDSR